MKNKDKGKIQPCPPFYVKIKHDRGYGDGIFKVKGQNAEEYDLFDPRGGTRFTIYKAHTYQDMECKRALVP